MYESEILKIIAIYTLVFMYKTNARLISEKYLKRRSLMRRDKNVPKDIIMTYTTDN